MSASSLKLISSRPAPPPPSLSSASPTSSATTQSPFSECRCHLVLHLHPAHLANLMDGIHAHLNSYLLTYQPQLDALVLAYSDVQLLSHTASIFYDRPYLNFPISLTLLTLALPTGTAHYGRVSKVAVDHITLLVYGVFHCVIHRNDIPPHYQFGTLVLHDGRRSAMMADTRQPTMDGWQADSKHSHHSTATADGSNEHVSKKQAAKQQKLQEKEERRQAYLRSQGQSADVQSNTDTQQSSSSDGNAIDHAIQLGSLVRFVILSSVGHDSFFSLSGSLTADGATVVAGDVVVPAELRAKEEAEEEERKQTQEAEANSVERLFANSEDDQLPFSSLDITITDADAVNATAGDVGHVSKKELKALKKQDKANRKQAKLLRKQMSQQQSQPAAQSTYKQTAPVLANGGGITVREKAAVLRRAEMEAEAEEVEKRRMEDNQVNSVQPADEGYSHVDAHLISEQREEDGVLKERRKKRSRLDETKGTAVNSEVTREKKKRREKVG